MTTLPIPSEPRHITAEWLTEALRPSGAIGDGRVVSFELHHMPEGVGLLAWPVRVQPFYEGAPAGAPERLVVKLPAKAPENVQLCAALAFYEREHNFYTRSARHSPLRTPRVFHSSYGAPASCALVMEDVRTTPGDQISGATAQQVRVAAKHLAAHHAHFWGRAHAGDQAWTYMPNEPRFVPVIQHLTAQGVGAVLQGLADCFTPATRKIAEALPAALPKLADAFANSQLTLVHGDYRVDNLLFGNGPDEPELTVIDWQISAMGCGPFDLAYHISQSVNVDVRRQIEADVLRTYHANLVHHGVTQYSFEACEEDYRRAMLYCLCYPLITGGVLDLANERGRALGRMMLERSLSAIVDLKADELLPQS